MKKLLISIFSVFLIVCLVYFVLPYLLKVEIDKIPESSIIYDSNNIEIGELIAEQKYRHRYRELDYFPEFLIESILRIEDKRFYNHSGIDYIALARALKNNLKGNTLQGASTINSQIIRNNYWLNKKRTYISKIKEFMLARALDKKYSKNQILEAYLNNINFGYLNYGFESASIYYYGKPLKDLTKAEIIGLITIIKNPNRYNPLDNPGNFRNRFEILTNFLAKNSIINDTQKNFILEQRLILQRNISEYLPYIIDFIARENIDKKPYIKTTFDYYLTKEIEKIGESTINTYAWKNVGDYGVIVIDRHTNDLKVMIGGHNYFGKDGQVNSTLALRQPGSTLKPFTYLLAFSELGYTPGSTILDLPVNYQTAEGNIYSPKNYTLDYKGEITLAQALSQSINIPAVKLLAEVGIQNFMDLLKKVGILSLDRDKDYYGLSVGLGSGEVSLYELTRSFSLFANNGKYCDLKYLLDVKTDCKELFDKKYTDMVFDILSDRYFKLEGFPINSNLDFSDREVFVKTGTSRNFKDNWTIGYTKDYLIGVWVGNKDASEMQGVSGVTGAGNIFNRIVYLLDDYNFSREPRNLEIFSKQKVTITSPLNNSIYKYVPSIPENHQKIKLDYYSNIVYDSVIWKLNGEIIEAETISIGELKEFNSIEIILEKNGEIVGSDESVVRFEN